MAKPRPHRPKGQSSGRPPSGHRRHSGSGPGGSGPRRPGGGPGSSAGAGSGSGTGGPRRRPAGAGKSHEPGRGHGHGHGHAQGGRPDRHRQHASGAERRDRAAGPAAKAAPRKGQNPQTAERLQKVLAQAGLGSRRGCEDLIRQGRVTIDGEVVTEMGTRVEPTARVAVDGEPIRRESIVYFAVNKPEGYVSTNSDPSGRPRVVDLVPEIPQRVYTVGRLDEDSTGLIILTNDGELANRLAHPKYGVEKLYRALVAGIAEPETLAKLTEGVWLSDGKVRAKRARVVGRQGQATMIELVLAEGRKREIRRMLAKLGHKVMTLTRIAVGPVTLKGLPVGECRPLTRHEVELLQQVADGVRLSVPGFPDEPRGRAPRAPARGHREATAAPPRNRRRDQEGPDESRGEHRRPQGGHRPEHRPRHAHGQSHGHGHGQAHGPGHGHARGPAQRPGGGRPPGPRRPGGPHGGPRPMRPRAMDMDDGPLEHVSGSPPTGGGPRGPRAGASGGGPPQPLGPRGAGGPAAKRQGGPRAGGPHGGPHGGPRAGGPHGGPRAGASHGGPPRPAGPRAGSQGPAPAGGPGPRSRPPVPPRPGLTGTQGQRDDQEGPPRRRIIGLKPSAAAPVPAGGRKRPGSRKPKPPRAALGRPDRLRPPRPRTDGVDGPVDE